MNTALKLLILEERLGDAALHEAALKHAEVTCEILRMKHRADFEQHARAFKPDVVLSGFIDDEWTTFDRLRQALPDVPLIIVSDGIGEERVVEALKRGASNYVLKSNLARLPDAVMGALDEARARLRAERLARLQALRAATASAIVKVSDRQQLFEAACRLAVKEAGLRMAWVGRVTPEASTLEPVAWSGHDEGYLEKVARLSLRVQETDCRGKAEAIRRYGCIVANDIEKEKLFIFKEEALARGYRAMIALPLIVRQRVVAVFKLYAAEPNYFGSEEQAMLTDIASGLSTALSHHDREERLCRLAYRDALTGLANRRLLHELVKQELARAYREKTRLAVVFIDLDDFKRVNDTLGHNAGDRLLVEVSSRMVSSTREGDIVARLGGDEFVMVLPFGSDREAVSATIERMLDSVQRTVRIEHRKVNVRCSIGVAVYPEDGRDYGTLLRNADAAMYRAKDVQTAASRSAEKARGLKVA